MAEQIHQMPIDRIEVAARHRKDMGDLAALAESIRREGLLQPIGITEDRKLVFGERRLRACRDILGQSFIDARIVKVTSIVAGEYAENEVREDFTPSERSAIAEAVVAELGKRQGARSDLPAKGKPAQLGGSRAAGETRAIAAKQAGFTSKNQLDRAKLVVDKGIEAVRKAMDTGEVSISAAAIIAKAPAPTQAAIVKMNRKERRAAVRDLREADLRKQAQDEEAQEGPSPQTDFVKQHGRLPSEREARKLAVMTGRHTLSSEGYWEPPLSDAERPEVERRHAVIDTLIAALDDLLTIETPASEAPACAEEYDVETITDRLARGLAWLHAFEKEWKRHVAKTAH